MTGSGRIHQVSTSRGGVPKRRVVEARVTRTGLEGDAVANPRIHGGPERAVCLYSLERIRGLQEEGHDVFPGALGENLTLEGLDWTLLEPGSRLRAGTALLEIASYTTPCSTTAPYVGGNARRIHAKHSPGWSRMYARVLEEGIVREGDAVSIVLPS